jgi:hypothetical protein
MLFTRPSPLMSDWGFAVNHWEFIPLNIGALRALAMSNGIHNTPVEGVDRAVGVVLPALRRPKPITT